MKIGLIGAGAIAQFLLKETNQNDRSEFHIKSIFVRNKEKYQMLEKTFNATLYTDVHAFLDSGIDLVVEAANIEAVKTLLPEVVKKKDAILISIGALADEAFLAKISTLANEHQQTLHLPSGAVGGLDLLQNAQTLDTVSSVLLTTRKPAHSLTDEKIEQEQVLFDGKAIYAIKEFPKNLNVSIVLSLAGIGIEKTRVRLVADPHIDRNMHQVEVEGDFGEATFSITNQPLPENPKTSYLAAMSVLGTLNRINARLKIGG